jgi:hypothetical protein
MGKQLVIPEEARVPGENHQPWACKWLFLKKRSIRREQPTMGKKLVILEEAEYPERTTNHGQVTGYS